MLFSPPLCSRLGELRQLPLPPPHPRQVYMRTEYEFRVFSLQTLQIINPFSARMVAGALLVQEGVVLHYLEAPGMVVNAILRGLQLELHKPSRPCFGEVGDTAATHHHPRNNSLTQYALHHIVTAGPRDGLIGRL